MILKFKNINPCLLLDNVSKLGINITVKNDCKQNESIAENVLVECEENNSEKIKDIVEHLDNTEIIIQATEQEKINAQLLKSNLVFQKALAEQKKINANLLLQIQSLQKKEGNN